jgi:hypothetical protein
VAVTEYRYELVIASPSPFDYKGVAWAPDGSEALIVGGIQAVLRYDGSDARTVAGGNWSTASQTLEEVAYAPDGSAYVCGGRLNGTRMAGDLWQVTRAGIAHVASVDSDMLSAVSVSTSGRVLCVGSVGNVYELVDGALRAVGKAGDVVLNDVAWAPDGSGAVIVGSPGVVRWFDAGKGALQTIAFTSTNVLSAVSWRPGTMTAWAAGEGGLVVEINATEQSASRVRPSSPRVPDLYGVSWNMDGDRALLVGAAGTTQLWRLGVFTTQSVVVDKDLLDVAWSPSVDEALVTGAEGTLLRYAPRLPPQNQPPTAVISSPPDGSAFREGTPITFDGSGSSDPEGDPLTFSWTDNATGPLGTDAVVHAGLPVGGHTVTLTVDDGQGHNSTATVAVSVERAPPPEQLLAIELTAPSPLAVVSGAIEVTGRASYEGGAISRVEVSVDDGPWLMAHGTDQFTLAIDTRTLEDGLHGLQVRATALDGTTKSLSSLFEVRNAVAPPAPPVPNVTLRLRERGVVDEPIRFEAMGIDPSQWEVVWTFGDGARSAGLDVLHAYDDAGSYEVDLLIYQPGSDVPVASYRATVIIERSSYTGPSLEGLAVIATVVAVGIYLVGFYVGRLARRDDGGDGGGDRDRGR